MMNKKILFTLFFVIVLGLFIPGLTIAGDIAGYIVIEPPIVHETFYELISALIKFIFNVALVLAPVMIIVGAFYFLTAAGDPEKIETGKQVIFYTLVGFVIILLARGMVEFLRRAFGIE